MFISQAKLFRRGLFTPVTMSLAFCGAEVFHTEDCGSAYEDRKA